MTDLYGYWRSAATYRVRVALALKGVAVREVVVNIEAGEQDAPGFRAINPQGALPALVEPGAPPLTQSLAILEYLEELHPEPALLPADPRGRARVRSLCAMVAADSHPLITPRVRRYLAAQHGVDAAGWKAWQTQWFGTALQAVEVRLGDGAAGRFCHGDRVGFADLCLMSCLIGVRVFGLDVGALPRITRVAAACTEIDAFARADPMRQPDAPAPG